MAAHLVRPTPSSQHAAECDHRSFYLCSDMEVDIMKPEWAVYVQNALNADKELRPNEITRALQTRGSVLVMYRLIQLSI